MPSPEFDPVAHEEFISERLRALQVSAARVAMFDSLIDLHHDGQCSFDEAISQYLHDLHDAGLDYDSLPAAPQAGV